MTVREFLTRLGARHAIVETRRADGAIEIQLDRGFRDATWSLIAAPAIDTDPLDDEAVRAICRELLIPASDVGL